MQKYPALMVQGIFAFLFIIMRKNLLFGSIFSAVFFITACQNNTGKVESIPDTTSNIPEKDTLVIIKEKKIETTKIVVKEREVVPEENKVQKISNPLSSWNNLSIKQKIITFVENSTTKGNKNYISPEERIAVFDNDGTLWPEKPTYFQIEFVFYRIKEMYPDHPEWKRNKLIEAAIKQDLPSLRKRFGVKGLGQLMSIAQSGITPDKFTAIVVNWLNTVHHPETGVLYKNMAYEPMIELIDYLHSRSYQVYIVSGAEMDFVRAMSESLFHVPKTHIIAGIQKLTYEEQKGKPVLIKDPEILYVIDGPTKAVAIQQLIGRRPVIAVGNADGDIQMLKWSKTFHGPSLQMLIHHTDSIREWAYDRYSKVGKLDKGLDIAKSQNWLLVDMKKDWKKIFYSPIRNTLSEK